MSVTIVIERRLVSQRTEPGRAVIIFPILVGREPSVETKVA